MQPRLTTLLMAALVALTAAFVVPSSRATAPGASYDIICVQDTQPAQKIPQRREVAVSSPAPACPAIPTPDFIQQIRFLNQSLFQRPPPAASLFAHKP
jgi:hypothetical protein